MIRGLDFLVFGSGMGIGAPFWDQRFYWLVDTMKGRKVGRGTFYTWSGWFGAQLQSFQWTHPNAGERRRLCDLEFKPFHSERRWFRVRVAWACTTVPAGIDEANAFLRALERKLGQSI